MFGVFALAAVMAILIGLAMGVSRTARGLFDPSIELYRPLSPPAYLLLVAIWLGIDERAKIVVIHLACLASIATVVCVGVRSATLEQINTVHALGASFTQVVRHVILSVALSEILIGLCIATGFGWTTLVATEMVATTVGVGQMVLNASNFLCTDLVVMDIVLIGAIAWVFDLTIRAIEARVVPWKGRGQSRLKSYL